MVEPVFRENSAFIVLSSSNEYVPYLYTALSSIIDNSSLKHNYDLLILEKNISDKNKEEILKLSQNNISIRFYHFDDLIKKYGFNFYTLSHVSVETYFKLCIPLLLKNISKCIFLDSDVIVKDDLYKLYSIDMEDYPICAAHCCLISGLYNYSNRLKAYVNNQLCLPDVKTYFQGGVLLINTNKWKELSATEHLIKSVQQNDFEYVDQCALNKFFVNSIKYIEQKWNYETVQRGFIPTYQVTDDDILKIHKEAKKDCAIIHYSGKYKPWFYPDEEFADIWWQYARKTPFYEEILTRMIQYQSNNENMQNNAVTQLRNELTKIHFPNINNRFIANEYNTKLNYVLEHMFLFKWIKFKYKIEKALSFGEKHERYKRKYKNVKQLIKDAKQLKKQFLNFNY